MQINIAIGLLVLALAAVVTSLPLERSKRQAMDLMGMNPMAGMGGAMGMMNGMAGMAGMAGMNGMNPAMLAANPMMIEDLLEPCEAGDCLPGQFMFTRNQKAAYQMGMLGPFLQAHARAQRMNAQRMAAAQAQARAANAAPGAAPPVAPPAGLGP